MQDEGPFASWSHVHSFEPDGAGTTVSDSVSFELPGGAVGRLGNGLAASALRRLFEFRHERLRHDLERHEADASAARLRVAVTGASGTIGRELVAFLESGGHEVLRLVRRAQTGPGELRWDPDRSTVERAGLEGLDAVVHLSGRRIDTRWSSRARNEITASRIGSTRFLAGVLASLERPPATLLAASAIGYYGDRGDEPLTEASGRGAGFLPRLCADWEAATAPASRAGIRVVNLRTGVVLTPRATPLSRLLLPWRLGLGATIDRGDAAVSWIAPDDVVGAILHLLRAKGVSGPVNLSSPEPATLRELADTLARVLGRPRFLRAPGALVPIVLGQMGRETLLASQRVVPQQLLASTFEFRYPGLERALRHALGRYR